MNRRKFLKSAVASSVVITLPMSTWASYDMFSKPMKIGLISDLHYDTMHDGEARLNEFLSRMNHFKPEVIFNLGDFAVPSLKNKDVINTFNLANKNSFHVIGNHDMDGGYTKAQVIQEWGMEAAYYVKTVKGVHFVVLDGNEKGSPSHKGGYASYIGVKQLEWLKSNLEKLEGPVIILSHQPLVGNLEVDNAASVREVLSLYKDKVILALNGHSHLDSLHVVDGINYVHLNSASYYWVGGKYKHKSYSEETHKNHPWIEYTCPYESVLFTEITFNPEKSLIKLEGIKSKWVGQSPSDLDFTPPEGLSLGKEIYPGIRTRKVKS